MDLYLCPSLCPFIPDFLYPEVSVHRKRSAHCSVRQEKAESLMSNRVRATSSTEPRIGEIPDPSVHPSLRPFEFIPPFVHSSLCPFITPFIHPFFSSSLRPIHRFIRTNIPQSIHPSVHSSLRTSIFPSIHISVHPGRIFSPGRYSTALNIPLCRPSVHPSLRLFIHSSPVLSMPLFLGNLVIRWFRRVDLELSL